MACSPDSAGRACTSRRRAETAPTPRCGRRAEAGEQGLNNEKGFELRLVVRGCATMKKKHEAVVGPGITIFQLVLIILVE